MGLAIIPPRKYRNRNTTTEVVSKYLGLEATVFQAEVLAILEACHHLFDYLNTHPSIRRTVIIYIDNQAALPALASDEVKSRTVAQCISSLSSLGQTTRIYLRYIKAHAGHVGNEIADKAAKLGSSRPVPYSRPLTYLPHSLFKAHIKSALYDAWNLRWSQSKTGQTKVWFPVLSARKSRYLLTQPRGSSQGSYGSLLVIASCDTKGP